MTSVIIILIMIAIVVVVVVVVVVSEVGSGSDIEKVHLARLNKVVVA